MYKYEEERIDELIEGYYKEELDCDGVVMKDWVWEEMWKECMMVSYSDVVEYIHNNYEV